MRIIFDENGVRGEVSINKEADIDTYIYAFIGALFTEGFMAETIKRGLESGLERMKPYDQDELLSKIK